MSTHSFQLGHFVDVRLEVPLGENIPGALLRADLVDLLQQGGDLGVRVQTGGARGPKTPGPRGVHAVAGYFALVVLKELRILRLQEDFQSFVQVQFAHRLLVRGELAERVEALAERPLVGLGLRAPVLPLSLALRLEGRARVVLVARV